jgi:hypothetical protein
MGLFSNISREGTGGPAANYARGHNEREFVRGLADLSAVWKEVLDCPALNLPLLYHDYE